MMSNLFYGVDDYHVQKFTYFTNDHFGGSTLTCIVCSGLHVYRWTRDGRDALAKIWLHSEC